MFTNLLIGSLTIILPSWVNLLLAESVIRYVRFVHVRYIDKLNAKGDC